MVDARNQVHCSSLAEHPDIKGVLPRFVARLPGQVQRLRELLAAQNVADLQRLLHQMRGSGKSFGFAGISDLAATAENRLQAGEPPEAVRQAVEALIDYLMQIEGYRP